MNRSITTIIAIAFLSGCAGEAEMQSVSGQTAAILNDYRSALQEFAASQSRLNATTEARLMRLGQLRETRRAEINARVDSWKLAGDDEALLQVGVISGTSAEEMLANASPQLPPPGLPALKYDSAEVDALIRPLIELKKPASAKRRAQQLFAYFVSADEAFHAKDLANATSATGAAEAQTAQNSKKTEEAAKAVD